MHCEPWSTVQERDDFHIGSGSREHLLIGFFQCNKSLHYGASSPALSTLVPMHLLGSLPLETDSSYTFSTKSTTKKKKRQFTKNYQVVLLNGLYLKIVFSFCFKISPQHKARKASSEQFFFPPSLMDNCSMQNNHILAGITFCYCFSQECLSETIFFFLLW